MRKKTTNHDWQDYETKIFERYKKRYPKSIVKYNDKIQGVLSGKKRQIDVSVTGKRKLIIVECKYLNSKVNITIIDALAGKMRDVKAELGIIVTTKGFTASTEKYAKNVNINIEKVDSHLLVDYGFVSANEMESDIFIQEIEYTLYYCKKCNKLNLYEIKIVRGFAEFEWIKCPSCNTNLFENRTDGGHKVIARFEGKTISEEKRDKIICKHILETRKSWDRKFSWDRKYLPKEYLKGDSCVICHKIFNELLIRSGEELRDYNGSKVCIECLMSSRNLLIDYSYIKTK